VQLFKLTLFLNEKLIGFVSREKKNPAKNLIDIASKESSVISRGTSLITFQDPNTIVLRILSFFVCVRLNSPIHSRARFLY
jgi:hypothetical protein